MLISEIVPYLAMYRKSVGEMNVLMTFNSRSSLTSNVLSSNTFNCCKSNKYFSFVCLFMSMIFINSIFEFSL